MDSLSTHPHSVCVKYDNYMVSGDPYTNSAPKIKMIGGKTVFEGEMLQFAVTAADDDNDSLTFSANNLPEGADFDCATSVFTWSNPVAGTYSGIRFEASDGELIDFKEITITVIEGSPPVIYSDSFDDGNDGSWVNVSGDWSIVNGKYKCTNAGIDSFGQSYVNSGAGNDYVIDCDINIQKNKKYGLFSDFPVGIVYSKANIGYGYNISIYSTGSMYLYDAVRGNVAHAVIPRFEYDSWHNVRVKVSPESDTQSRVRVFFDGILEIEHVIDAVLNARDTGVFVYNNYGYPNITEGMFDNYVVRGNTHPNSAPELDPIGDRTVSEGEDILFSVSGSDPDYDLLTYSASNLPDGTVFDQETRTFTWHNPLAGTYEGIHFVVSDGDLTDSEDITITVNEGLPASHGDREFKTIIGFESHNWHALEGWGDPNILWHSTAWKTEGKSSMDLWVDSTCGNMWSAFSTGCFDPETPDSIVFDVKCQTSYVTVPGFPKGARLKIEALDTNGEPHEIDSTEYLVSGQDYLDVTINNTKGYTIRMLRFIVQNYFYPVHVYVDNIRFVEDGNTVLWDPCEDEFYWDGTADADNKDIETVLADSISLDIYSPNMGSTASQVLEWDSSINEANSAEIQMKDILRPFNISYDMSDYWYFRFDAYRPSTTPNVNISIYLYDGVMGVSTLSVNLDTPDQWETFTIPLFEANSLKDIKEVKIVVLDTNTHPQGRLYFDNLQVGGFIPEIRPVDASSLGYTHVVKDFSEGLEGNGFNGKILSGGGNGGSISQQISTTQYNTSPALKVDYDVSAENSYIYYCNTLNANSDKQYLSLFLKGGIKNPGRVKLELHDQTWIESGGTNGSAYCYLSGISDNEWKQWIVNVNSADLSVLGSFDPAKVVEVVVSLDNRVANFDAKSGTFYIDDITFIDLTDVLTPLTGYILPEENDVVLNQIGVPYLLDDYDGRVLDEEGKVIDLGYDEFFGYTGLGKGGSEEIAASYSISSDESEGSAHSIPNSCRIDYSFPQGEEDAYLFYYNLMSVNEALSDTKDMSLAEVFSIWLKGDSAGNPGTVKVEFHDENWSKDDNYTNGNAYCYLQSISGSEWQQYLIPLNTEELIVVGSFDITKLKEVVISLDYGTVTEKTGALYIDDMNFVDTDMVFTTEQDFTSDQFLDLVERRTFQYFLECYDENTGLVLDRVHFRDMATTAGTGFGLTAMAIGVERGWIDYAEAEAYVLKVLNNLWSTPQGPGTEGISGYKGFYYHFLEAETGLRTLVEEGYAPVELSIVDTALLMNGVITCREYFSSNQQIVDLADNLFNRVEWDWFLDTTGSPDPSAPDYNPNYYQFYLGWSPEGGFQEWHWDYATDENLIIDFLAVASPTHPVLRDVFYSWERNTRSYNGHDVVVAYNGAMFQYFFANCWYDLYNKADAQGVNWWSNSVQAGLANRDYCIAGVDGRGRENVSTYSENSWGITACEGVPSELNDIYLGGNGARPNGNQDVAGEENWQTDGTIAPYGGISMIGFSAHPEGIPAEYITSMMQNYYQNTQLWTGWYGFRDSYTDTDQIKTIKVYDNGAWVDKSAISLYPQYKAAYFSIDQGPMLIMLENYRSGLVWNYFMQNTNVQNAMNILFSPNNAPVLAFIGDKTADEGEPLQFTVTASDLENDQLTYSASNLPAGAELDTQTGEFTWNAPEAGVYTGINFEVSDGVLTDSEEITITVNESGLPVIYSDNFDDGADDGWIKEDGIWSVSDGEYTAVYTSSIRTKKHSYVTSGAGLNYIIDCDINLEEGCNAGIVYSKANTGSGYSIDIYRDGKIYMCTPTGSTSYRIPWFGYNTWHHVRVEVSEESDTQSRVKVYFDGALKVNRVLNTVLDGLNTGVHVYNDYNSTTRAKYDNYVVRGNA